MFTIVDGYNLIFAWGWLLDTRRPNALEISRQRLVRELAARIPVADRGNVTIVFDANTKPCKEVATHSTASGFQMVFAQAYDDADTLIEELIRQHSNPKMLTVVSSDNRLKTAAMRRKAKTIDSEQWLDELEKSAQATSPRETGNQNERLSAKERAIRELAEIDWSAEFDLNDLPPELDPNAGQKIKPETYNPFPPGYGEDL